MLDILPVLAEYGIAVFSVGVSLAVVWLLMSKFIRHSESQSRAFTDAVADLADRHERERGTWIKSESERLARSDAVLSELKDAIRESIQRNREGH